MTPKDAYACFVFMCALDPMMFARSVAAQPVYPADLRKHAQDYIEDPEGFLNSIA
jgi:hypothetical protein